MVSSAIKEMKATLIIVCGSLLLSASACGDGFERFRGPEVDPAPGDTVLSVGSPYTEWIYRGDKKLHCGEIVKYDRLPLYIADANDATTLSHEKEFHSLEEAKLFVKSFCDR